MGNIRNLFKDSFFRKIISCNCYEHLISVEVDEGDDMGRLRWWAAPEFQDTSLKNRIRAAMAMLSGKGFVVDDFVLTDRNIDQLIDTLIEAKNIMAHPTSQSKEETEEIYRAVSKIKKKYGTLPMDEKVG